MVIQEFKASQEDWKRFGERIFQEIELLQERVRPELQVTPDKYFQKDINILTEELRKIRDTIQSQRASRRLKRFLRMEGDAQLLRRLNEDFTRATMHFSIRQQLAKMEGFTQVFSSEPLNELPPKPTCFHGQEEYIKTVTSEIFKGYERGSPSRISIHGSPGLGKTTVTRSILHDAGIEIFFNNHRYFISCEACVTPALLLSAISTGLGSKVDGEHETLLSRVMKFLRSIKSPVLLVLDNFETTWNCERKSQVQDLLERLAALKNTTLMVTMRSSSSPDGTFWADLPRLEVLDPPSARQVFKEVARVDEGPDSQQLDRLLCRVGYLPQAIVLLARLIRNGETIATLHQRWPTEGIAMISTITEDHHYNLDASFRLSIFSPPMVKEPFALRLLITMAHLPDGITREHLENITSIPKDKIHHATYALSSVGLAEYEGDVFKSIAPIRQYIVRNHPPPDEDIIKTRRYCRLLVTSREHGGWPDVIQAFERIAPELGNIYETLYRWINSGNDIDKAASTVLKLSRLLFSATDSTDVLEYFISKQLAKVSPAMQAALLQTHGMLLASSEDYPSALKSLTQAIPIHQDLSNTLAASGCLWQIGEIFRLQGQYYAALDPLEKALDGYRQIGSKAIESQASCLWSLADTQHVLGESSSALASVQEADALYRGINNEEGMACVTLVWISIELSRDNFVEAQKLLDGIRDFKVVEQSVQKNYLLEKGKIFFFTGELERAKNSLQCCLSLCESNHRASKQSRGDALRFLGMVALHEKDTDDAERCFVKAEEIYSLLGNKLNIAELTVCFALLHLLKGAKPAARNHFIIARDIFKGLGCKRSLAICLSSIAKLDAEEGDRTEAIAQLKHVESLYNDIGNTPQATMSRQIWERLSEWTNTLAWDGVTLVWE